MTLFRPYPRDIEPNVCLVSLSRLYTCKALCHGEGSEEGGRGRRGRGGRRGGRGRRGRGGRRMRRRGRRGRGGRRMRRRGRGIAGTPT